MYVYVYIYVSIYGTTYPFPNFRSSNVEMNKPPRIANCYFWPQSNQKETIIPVPNVLLSPSTIKA